MKKIIYVFFLLISIQLKSQFNKYWYFGSNAGLNFTSPAPTILTNGQTTIVDNTSTISDANGNLLFYTDGTKVWNKNHIIMPNGNGLIGNFTAGQVCLIVPIPCNNSKYVIFHHTEYSNPGDMYYTVVDMNLNGGLGDVIVAQKNMSLGTTWTEKLCAYYNPAGNYYWVLSHKWMSDQFVAMKVDATTIATTSVVTSIGSNHNCGTVSGTHDAMGQLTISPDGSKVINAMTCQDKFELFDFNINTGVLSNSISIPGNGGSAWGTAFSPDSKKIYVNSIFGQSVFQYDITTYSGPAIIGSKTNLYTTGTGGYNFGYMELGPDGKVYIGRPNTTWLSVVNNPNIAGSGCNFSFSGQSTGAKQSLWGLSRIAYNIPLSSTGGTLNVSSTSTDPTCSGFANGSATINVGGSGTFSYQWAPGGYTNSAVSNLSAGNYTVTVSSACGTGTTLVQVNTPPGVSLTVSPSGTVCPGGNAVLTSTATGGSSPFSYSWTPGNFTTNTITIAPTVSTVYTVTVKDALGCTNTKTTSISVSPVIPGFNFSLNPCSGQITTTNTSSGATNYQWNFGDGNSSSAFSPSQTYTVSGNYTIQLIASNSTCSDTIEQNITINPVSHSAFTFTAALCDSTVLFSNNSSNASYYLWNFGDGSSSTLENPGMHTYKNSSTYSVSLITNPGTLCADTSSQSFIITKNSFAEFNLNVDVCNKTLYTNNTSSLASTYFWSFGDGATSSSFNPQNSYSNPGNYSVTLITNPGTTCADTASKITVINPPPFPSFTYSVDICSGRVSFTNTSQNSSNFYWSFGNNQSSIETNPSITYSAPGNYSVSLIAEPTLTCSGAYSQFITVNLSPVKAEFSYVNPEFTYDLLFTNLSTNAVSFVWDFGDGTNSNFFAPGHTYEHVGEHTICLEATNSQGCKDLICKKISVDADWTLYVPNTFTPNDDNKNDVFHAYGSNMNSFKMIVFDRWGEQLFYSDELLKGWDGTYNGKPVQEGVYVWKILAVDMYRKSHELTGHVTVIR